jgi:tRNA nucleotidyltransferase (CCA-adding enzyme)
MSLLKQTVRESFLQKIKPDRLKEELHLILALPDFPRYLYRMYQLDMFPSILPGCVWKGEFEETYRKLFAIFKTYDISSCDPFLLKLSPLFGSMDPCFLNQLKERLALSRKTVQKIATYVREKENLLMKLSQKNLKNSEAYLLCSAVPLEFLLLSLASWEGAPKERIQRYLEEWRAMKPLFDGSFLQALGVPEGPIYGRILHGLFLAQIDGEVKTEEEGVQRIRYLMERVNDEGKNI